MLWLHQPGHATCHPLSDQTPPLATLQLLVCCADWDIDASLLWLLPEAAEQTVVALLWSAAAAADQVVALLPHFAAAADHTVAVLLPAADQTAAAFHCTCADLSADCIAALTLQSRHKEWLPGRCFESA